MPVTLLAGFGQRDITPPLGVELSGYGYYLNRRAERVDDPLFARALYLECGQARAVLVVCDVLGLSDLVAQEARERISRTLDVRPGAVMLLAIHTHTGSALIEHEGCGKLDPCYPARIPDILLAAACDAAADAALVTGARRCQRETAEHVAYNRALPDGPLDETVRGLWLSRAGARDIALLSFACHPVTRGRSAGISADYPGGVCRLLNACGAHALFVNGACGDVDPIPCADDSFAAHAALLERTAQTVVDAFLAGLENAPVTAPEAGRLPAQVRVQSLDARAARATVRAVALRDGEQAATARVARVWLDTVLPLFDAGVLPEENFEAAYLRLCGLDLVALPFEIFTGVAQRVRAGFPQSHMIVAGGLEQLRGYLPAQADFERGAYASVESVFLYKRLPLMPGTGEEMADGLCHALRTAWRM